MAFLNERSENSGAQVLHVRIRWCRTRVGKEVRSFDGDLVQHERAHDASHRHDAKLLKVFRA